MQVGLPSPKRAASRENVRVVCRVRPQNTKEIAMGGTPCVTTTHEMIDIIDDNSHNNFSFDKVFGFESTQKEVFEETAVPLVKDVLNGYNATIFAYGQTGTGKTHTMEGNIRDPELKGIIPRVVEALFDGVGETDDNIEFTFIVSYVEIYMEKIRDLLDDTKLKNNLSVREDKIKGLYIAGVTEEYVTSVEELLEIMSAGANNRATAATGMNEGSSRSHSVFTITVSQLDTKTKASKSGKLVLVDLAGSETVRKTGASGQQLEEAKTINKSLSALGGVINALTDERQTHIPYRDSKLTRLLQDSLGGNSKTVLIIAVSPSTYNAAETISTCRFGMRAKSITNKVKVNQTLSNEELQLLLNKAEKTIELQAGQILTLANQVQTLNKALNGEVVDLSFISNLSKNSSNTNINTTNNDDLQETINNLTSDLEDEKNESTRKDNEIIALQQLIKEKENLLKEAGELLIEAQYHYENQKERSDSLTKEKSEIIGQLDSIKIQLNDEISKYKFAISENEVTIETLRAENDQLRKEISEMSGDHIDRPNNKSLPSKPINNSTTSLLTNESNTKLSSNDNELAINLLDQLDGSIVKSALEGGLDMIKIKEQFTNLCNEFNLSEDASLSIWNIIRIIVIQYETTISSSQSQIEIIQKMKHEHVKRLKETDIQRIRLEKDLQLKSEKVIQQQLLIDDIKNMNSLQLNEFFNERERNQMKSLQQRLEQLVAVHRQLLRKFASLELENIEYKKKILLRDERIKQLENNSKTVTSNMRQQAERHVAELSNLREQIQMLRTEHQKRIEMIKSNESTNDKNLSTAFSFRHSEQPRSIRGGVSFAVDKSVRGGKNKNIFNTISEDQSNDGSNQNEDVDESPTKRQSISSTGGFLSKLLGTNK